MQKKAIILAAGKGSRMKSDMLKVLHHVAGKPILEYVINSVLSCDIDHIYIVVGHQEEKVKDCIKHPAITFVTQHEQLGTGHAVMQVEPLLSRTEDSTIIILAGDCPLIEHKTLMTLLANHMKSQAAATILSAAMDDPGSYGRILRDTSGNVTGIKEAKDCSSEQLNINEINTGIYTFSQDALCSSLSKITTENKQNEYYLTDAIHILNENGDTVDAYCTQHPDQAVGINTRHDLAQINDIIYRQNNHRLMDNGVTIIDPKTTYIDSTVSIDQDVIIHPFSSITGRTTIEKGAEIGPHAYIKDAHISARTRIGVFEKIIGEA